MKSALFNSQICFVLLILFVIRISTGSQCFSCRSRGKFGDCKDPFPYNSTYLTKGVTKSPCPSEWCLKRIEGDEHGEDHDLATGRGCLQKPPPDDNPRCSEAMIKHKKVFVCFCKGMLCNATSKLVASPLAICLTVLLSFILLM